MRRQRPDATLILLTPPSPDAQRERMRSRGDAESHIAERLRAGAEEERAGRAIADAEVVNHEVAQATADVAAIVEGRRSADRRGRPEPVPAPEPARRDPAPDRPEGS